jgi:murein L,D-transpeptidase YcbB/YkuD
MKSMKSQLLGLSALTLMANTQPAVAAQSAAAPSAAVAAPVSSLSAMGAVASFYDQYKPSIWYKGGAASPAAAQLVTILRRAPIEGLSFGPQLADQVEAAMRQAASGTPADVSSAERTLSAALVTYVQALKRPTPGMIYAYQVLSPQGGRADQILLTAAAAPSLEVYLSAASNINPIYSSIRDAAFRQAQASGNLTPDPRLLANLERARTLPARGKFAMVDSASQRLFMYENGQIVDSMKVVVGDANMKPVGLPTPLIASVMHYMTYNPYWNVPHHLVRKIVAPGYLKGGVKYLSSHGYEVMSDWTDDATVIDPTTLDWKAILAGDKQIRVRTLPGPNNSMGKMKFPFPNGQDIFLHDTPAREHFAKAQRTISNGCVRLEDAKRFARWLLGREPVAPSDGREVRVQLPAGVPIYLTYITAQPTETGITYLKDVYDWDHPSTQQVAGAQPTGIPVQSAGGH